MGPNTDKNGEDDTLLSESNRNHRRMCFDLLLVFFKSIVQFFQYIYELFIPRPLKDVKGQLALITGGSKGIGRDIGLCLASKGCNIAILCRDIKIGEKTAQEMRDLGVNAKAYKADVSRHKEISHVKEMIDQEMGPVDMLINNAGMLFEKKFSEEKPENYQRMMDTNFMSIVWTTQLFLEGMIERKRGHIVSMSSIYGLTAAPIAIVYSATKFAIRGFMESLAMDLNHRDLAKYIKTSCVFPSMIDTNEDVRAVVEEGLYHKIIMSPKYAATRIVDEILQNKEIITLPRYLYYLCYLT